MLLELNSNVLSDFIYRGEGNSSIVIALRSHAKVIRLLKKDGKIMKTSQDHHVREHPMRSLNFIHLIMKPLTDPYLSGSTELIHLKSELINRLSKQLEAHRPPDRLDKTLVLDDQYALVMDDLCTLPRHLTRQISIDDLCGPTISVEIKPKQGFLPSFRQFMKSVANDQSLLKIRSTCLYNSTQYLKLIRGKIDRRSDYCPINLFSGCPERMRSALAELIKNPQNNFRIFRNLILAYGENKQEKLSALVDDFFDCDSGEYQVAHPLDKQVDKTSRLIDLLIQCLLNEQEFSHNDQTPMTNQIRIEDENSFSISNDQCSQHYPKSKCKTCATSSPQPKKHKSDPTKMSHGLPPNCVLSSVLKAQKLDTIGAHEAQYMLEWLKKSVNPQVDILKELSRPQMPVGFGKPNQQAYETKSDFYLRKVWEFLVSLTAKDCSIIVTLRRISTGRASSIAQIGQSLNGHLLKEQKTDNYFLFNVGIADLDQKMPLKIQRICENLNHMIMAGGDQSINDDTMDQQHRPSNHALIVSST